MPFILACETRINDTVVTHSSGMYGYRSYLQSLVSFDDGSKATNLFLSGWMSDTSLLDKTTGIYSIEPSKENEGLKVRNCWFREGCRDDLTKPYSKEGMTFVSLFRHEFTGVQTIFPPATKVQFTLSKISITKHQCVGHLKISLGLPINVH